MGMQSYVALIYRDLNGDFVAESPAFSEAAGIGATPGAALQALAGDIREALDSGETAEPDDEATITTLTLPPDVATRAYTAIVTHNGGSYSSYCPAIGAISQGDTLAEALDGLQEAGVLMLRGATAPDEDTPVHVERVDVETPDVALAG